MNLFYKKFLKSIVLLRNTNKYVLFAATLISLFVVSVLFSSTYVFFLIQLITHNLPVISNLGLFIVAVFIVPIIIAFLVQHLVIKLSYKYLKSTLLACLISISIFGLFFVHDMIFGIGTLIIGFIFSLFYLSYRREMDGVLALALLHVCYNGLIFSMAYCL